MKLKKTEDSEKVPDPIDLRAKELEILKAEEEENQLRPLEQKKLKLLRSQQQLHDDAIMYLNIQRRLKIYILSQHLKHKSLNNYLNITIYEIVLYLIRKMKKQAITLKLLVIGDSGVGKTSLLMRYCEDQFQNNMLSTVGVDFKIKRIFIGKQEICLNIWDTAGQERFKNITKSFYKNSQGILLTYSIDNKISFSHVQSWIDQIRENGGLDIKVLLIGNKCDNQSKRQVTKQEADRLAARYNMTHIEASAKENKNIDFMFTTLANQIYKEPKSLTSNPPQKTNEGKSILIKSNVKSKERTKQCCI